MIPPNDPPRLRLDRLLPNLLLAKMEDKVDRLFDPTAVESVFNRNLLCLYLSSGNTIGRRIKTVRNQETILENHEDDGGSSLGGG